MWIKEFDAGYPFILPRGLENNGLARIAGEADNICISDSLYLAMITN
jgi:hypothetical protein